MVVVSIPYGDYVVNAEDALVIANVMARAERYQEKYRGGEPNTYHVYPVDGRVAGMHIISDDLYRMAKLAGKPEEK